MSFRKGSKVWTEDIDSAWVEAEVLDVRGKLVVMISPDKLLPRDPDADHGGVDDMTKLTYLNEPGVLYNLARRYSLNEIYLTSEESKSVEVSKLQKSLESLKIELDAEKRTTVRVHEENYLLQRQIDKCMQDTTFLERNVAELNKENLYLKAPKSTRTSAGKSSKSLSAVAQQSMNSHWDSIIKILDSFMSRLCQNYKNVEEQKTLSAKVEESNGTPAKALEEEKKPEAVAKKMKSSEEQQQSVEKKQQKDAAVAVAGAEIWCELCKLKCNSMVMLNSHLSGKKHKYRMEESKKKKHPDVAASSTTPKKDSGNSSKEPVAATPTAKKAKKQKEVKGDAPSSEAAAKEEKIA